MIFLFVCIPMLLQAQEPIDLLRLKSGFWGLNYFMGDQKVPYDSIIAKLNSDRQLTEKFETSNTIRICGNVVSGIGSFLVGYDMGGRLFRGNNMNSGVKTNNGKILYTGVALLLSGLIVSGICEVQMQKALTQHNKKTIRLQVKPAEEGLGVAIVF